MDIRLWLERCGLEAHAKAFEREELTVADLPDLTDGELRDLGLSLGGRKALRRALGAGSSAVQGTPAPPAPAAGESFFAGPTVAESVAGGGAIPTAIDGFPVEGVLGQGGMGSVYRVRDRHTDRPLALKTLRLDLVGSAGLRARFMREYGLLQGLSHRHVVRVYAMGEDAQCGLYYTMELLAGGSLEARVQQDRPSPAQALAWWQQIADGVASAHAAGVWHRDLKPANVVFRDSATPVVADWGLGGGATGRSRTGAVGTAVWAAPEQSAGVTGAFTDVYGLSALLLWLLTEELPTNDEAAIGRYVRDVGADVRFAPVLARGLAGRRRRYGEVGELISAVVEASTQVPAAAVEPPAVVEAPSSPSWVPSWSSDHGSDTYGRWASLAVSGEVQRLRWCPPGRFWMGSRNREEGHRIDETHHEVVLTCGFWLADTACTQALWVAVTGSNPSEFTGDLQRPVENVSWDDCQAFLSKLNLGIAGLSARLPTEAEWEYACRAGTWTPFCYGARISTDEVNYDGSYPYGGGAKGLYRGVTVPVATMPANTWGLYEMHGNVFEWCRDGYSNYPLKRMSNSKAPSRQYSHVSRGGCWAVKAHECRAAYRNEIFGADLRSSYHGFRFCVPGQETEFIR